MGLSTITAMVIANRDDLDYSYAGPAKNGKYTGWITMPNSSPLLNTEPVFDTPELAVQYMTDLRDKCIEHFDP